MGVSCNAEYKKSNSYSSNVKVDTYYGEARLNDKAEKKWYDYGVTTAGKEEGAIHFKTPNEKGSDAWKNSYKTEYKSSKSYQTCGVSARFYKTTNGEPDDEKLSDLYWAAKEGPAVKLQTGFRIWKKEDSSDVWKQAQSKTFTYKLADWADDGVEKPKPKVIIPDDDEMDGGKDGALSLVTATATALAALLLM